MNEKNNIRKVKRSSKSRVAPGRSQKHLLRMAMALEEFAFAGVMPVVISIARSAWSNFDFGSPSEQEVSELIMKNRELLQAMYDKITGAK